MATPYLGQLLLCSFTFAPKGYAFCNGQLLPINQNQALFSLLGTTYGGDGRTTFALPNLQSRIAVGPGSGVTLGQTIGSETVTLTSTQLPSHTHQLSVAPGTGSGGTPAGNTVGVSALNAYAPAANDVMAASAMNTVGGTQSHENRSPFLTLNWVIALQGIFPSRN